MLAPSPAVTVYWQGGYRIHMAAPYEWNVFDKEGVKVASFELLDHAREWLDHRENQERTARAKRLCR